MTIFKWLALWMLLFIAIGAIGRQPWMNYYRLSKRSTTAPGVARAAKPHRRVVYTFQVDGHGYEGIGRRELGGRRIAVGDDVLVYYLPDNPKISCLGDPKALFQSELPALLISDFLFCTIVVGLLAIQARRGERRAISE